MKARLLTSILVFLTIGLQSILSQGFQPPAEGKAVVYFVRVSAYGGAVSFEYFHQDKYIGFFKGVNYLRYECEPGEQLFWASSENKEFITADLKAGGTYIVIVDVIMGMMKAHVGLKPMPQDDKELFERVKKVVSSRDAKVTDDKTIEEKNKKLGEKFIPEQLKKYNEEWKGTRNFKHISADMAIAPEDLK
jgi:hypothetical protein